MGFWGTKISDNDGTADVLIDWGKLVNKKHLNSDGYLENWAKAKITTDLSWRSPVNYTDQLV